MALGHARLDGLDRRRYANIRHLGRGTDALDLLRLLDHAQFRKDVRAVLRHDLFRLGVRMSHHAHHGLGQEGVFEADRPFADAKMLEVVRDGVDHADLILEADDVIEMSQLLHILNICGRHAERHFAIFGDHGISAQASVASQVEHVGWLGQQEHVNAQMAHVLPALRQPVQVDLFIHRSSYCEKRFKVLIKYTINRHQKYDFCRILIEVFPTPPTPPVLRAFSAAGCGSRTA